MPIGNYTYQPKNRSKIQVSDIEEFILGLLKDICSESANTHLQRTKVNYGNDFNLSDESADTDLLVSFELNTNDPRNANLNAQLGERGNVIKVVYTFALFGKRGDISTQDFLKAWEEIIDAITDNYNSGVNYQATLSTGKVLTSPLTLNESDSFPNVTIMQENRTEINYLTANTNIVLSITKEA